MSEYQYYEFQAIDRPLTKKEMEELRSYSTRARITPTSFVNDDSWGSFKGNEDAACGLLIRSLNQTRSRPRRRDRRGRATARPRRGADRRSHAAGQRPAALMCAAIRALSSM